MHNIPLRNKDDCMNYCVRSKPKHRGLSLLRRLQFITLLEWKREDPDHVFETKRNDSSMIETT